MIEVQHDRVWHDIVTRDESWFCLSTDHKFIWLPQSEKVPESERCTIQSKKFMLTIVWNPRGFHLIDVLARGCKCNATDYVTEILSVLSKWHSTEAKGDGRTLIVHAENAHPHTAQLWFQFFELNRMKTAPHPLYSHDFAPSDFYLFGENADELLESGRSVVGGNRKSHLAGSLSRVDGAVKEMYRSKWRVC
jgi:hypothetical protein